MKSAWITTFLIGLIATAEFWMLCMAAEVQQVQMGSTVTLGCNISYLYDTTWLKNNPDLPPTVIFSAGLRQGQLVTVFQLSPRYSVGLTGRSLALTITDVEEKDLGLYFCIASVNSRLTVAGGTMLQGSRSDRSVCLSGHWYSVALGCGLLVKVVAVCVAHWKAKRKRSERQ